jgi:uncharacterized cofD-like protein
MKKNDLICTIGGGTGMPIVNKALVKAGFSNIKSIVTPFDSGGDTGRIRTDERGKVLAFSDYWRALISLWIDGMQKRSWEEVLKFRDGRGRNFGNSFFQFLAEKTKNFSDVGKLFVDLTRAELKGEVIPVSLEPAELCFLTESNKEYCGEHHLDDLRMSRDLVKKIWLSKKVKANKGAVSAIINAKLIIFCPGSMYGSVIINLLPLGMSSAFLKTKAVKLLMTNIMSVANENRSFTQVEYARTFKKYIGSDFNEVLMPDFSKLNQKMLVEVFKSYSLENSRPIKYKKNEMKNVVVEDVAVIDELNLRIRHSEDKLARFFARMVK